MLAAPATGWLGDHYPRKPLIVCGALFFSAINFFTATVHTFFTLNLRHAALGIGEASFGIFAPALLADFYPEEDRNRVLTIFYTAIPVGAALGYLAGGVIGGTYGWRFPFYVSAIPGVVIALLVLFCMKEPKRGAMDKPAHRNKATMLSLARNAPYLYATLGMAMITFSLGGISAWMPSFLQRMGYSAAGTGTLVGGITAVTGITGTLVGGWLAQLWMRRNRSALYLLSAWSALLAVPPALLCFFGPRWALLPGFAMAEFCIFLGTGPLNAAIVNSVNAAVRATAVAIELFLIHALGDLPSPVIIGAISDRSTLALGLGVTLVTMVIAAVLLFAGARTVHTVRESAT